MKNYSHTLLPTIKTYDNENILFNQSLIPNFVKKTFFERVVALSEEERDEFFRMSYEYEDVLFEMFDGQIENLTEAGWTTATDTIFRNPTEEYENYASLPKDADLTDEEHQLKLEHLRQFKEWFEKQNY
jgi:hypothetical protein